MMYNKNAILGGLLALSVASAPAWAAVSASEAARLGQELTPFGSPKAGNSAGTIPAWTGGLTEPPPGYEAADSTTSIRSRMMKSCLPSRPPTWISMRNTLLTV